MCRLVSLLALLLPLGAFAQSSPDLNAILTRLDTLERENRALTEEIKQLREQLAALQAKPAQSVQEQLDVQKQRIEEQAQTKVEASQKFPIRLSGALLANAYMNSKQSGGFVYPTFAAATGTHRDGLQLRQTIIGLEFNGPHVAGNGAVSGNVYMDFFSGTTPLGQTMRLRTGHIEIAWKDQNILAGIEKPIFNPREPSSLAQVGVSPMTGAGNLWLWVPQVRLEQDFSFGWRSGLRARMGVIETQEVGPYDTPTVTFNVERARPGLEGRFELFHNFDDDRRIEIATGFHESTTHAAGFSIPSDVWSLDWFMNPWKRVELTGAFYDGENVANLGTGLINQGYAVFRSISWPIGSAGGWGQFTIHTLPRLDAHIFFGDQQYATRYLGKGDQERNIEFGANLYFRIAPNVILAPEFSQIRSRYIGQSILRNNHYDLALAYLF
jgi:hypothetical protein